MCRLLESIKCKNGALYNLKYHEARMEHAISKNFKVPKKIKLAKLIKVPKEEEAKQGLYKCRIVYNQEIQEITFSKYKRKKIKSIKLVVDESISYPHKFENRDRINKHTKFASKGEEIIFVKNGMLRDASFSNIALFNGSDWHTPSYPLLKGTKRAELLDRRIITTKKLKPVDLKYYTRISFINAMNDLNELFIDL